MHTHLFLIILAAMQFFVPVEQHAYYETRVTTEARYESIADDTATVVEEASGPRIESVEFEAKLLASIGGYESAYRADVDACKTKGPSFTIFQVSTHRRYVCGDRKNAVRVALYRIRESFAVCDRLPFGDRLSFFTSGRCEHTWFSRSRVKRAIAFQELQ